MKVVQAATQKGETMIELGKKKDVFGSDLLRPIHLYDRPRVMPTVHGEEKVICGYDQGLGERLFVCDDLGDMQTLYDSYAKGGAVQIHWYTGEDPGFVHVTNPLTSVSH